MCSAHLRSQQRMSNRETTMDIGFIGLGNMGFPMARRLIEGGHRLVVFATRKEVVEPVVARGASLRHRRSMLQTRSRR